MDNKELIEFYQAKILQLTRKLEDLEVDVEEAEEAWNAARRALEACDDRIFRYEQELEALLNETNSG